MLSNRIVKLGEFMYRVYPYSPDITLELGNAYTFGGRVRNASIMFNYVLPYRGEFKKKHEEPGIYLDKDGDIRVIIPKTERDIAMYNVDRILELTPETINKELDQYLGDIDLTDLKFTGDVFVPEIKETDDVGMKAIRLALIAKKIDFNSYSGRFEKPYDKANARKALMRDSTLTFSKLKQYADVFDLEYGVILFDKDDARDPISEEGNAMIVFNDRVYEIDDPRIIAISTVDDALEMNKRQSKQ